MKRIYFIPLVLIFMSSVSLTAHPPSKTFDGPQPGMTEDRSSDHLLIVWTSGDPDVALKMVFMYAYNAQKNGWWEQVTLLVWGPSAKLTSEDEEIQASLKNMKDQGVELLACKACADMYGVSSKLEELGIEVKYTGTYLTDFIKSGKNVVTF
jgi:hypothetical protein